MMAMSKATHPWDKARRKKLIRKEGDRQVTLEPGVNYFVEKLEAFGAKTQWSCEGHPNGFYIVFFAPYILACLIHSCGFFTVEVEGPNRWSIRIHYEQKNTRDHYRTLRWASSAWERVLNPILEGLHAKKQGTI